MFNAATSPHWQEPETHTPCDNMLCLMRAEPQIDMDSLPMGYKTVVAERYAELAKLRKKAAAYRREYVSGDPMLHAAAEDFIEGNLTSKELKRKFKLAADWDHQANSCFEAYRRCFASLERIRHNLWLQRILVDKLQAKSHTPKELP